MFNSNWMWLLGYHGDISRGDLLVEKVQANLFIVTMADQQELKTKGAASEHAEVCSM